MVLHSGLFWKLSDLYSNGEPPGTATFDTKVSRWVAFARGVLTCHVYELGADEASGCIIAKPAPYLGRDHFLLCHDSLPSAASNSRTLDRWRRSTSNEPGVRPGKPEPRHAGNFARNSC